MFQTNLILATDSYKHSHAFLFPKNTTSSFYYLEPRYGEYDNVVFFGLQYYIKEYLTKPITQNDIDEASLFLKAHGEPFYREGWQYILDNHSGYLPLKIRAVPEGSIISIKNVLLTVESTDAKCFWLPGFIETLLLKLWYPTTIATRSKYIKNIILNYLEKSSDNPQAEIDWKLHAFGYRGNSSEESSGIAGAAELISFKGSDTINGVRFANHYYNCEMAGFSIPATEHSFITSFGKENEEAAYSNFLDVFAKKDNLIACVCDSYDVYNCLDNIIGKNLKEKILSLGTNLVCRLDSGDPAEVVCKSAHILEKNFGSTINSKGFKVLNNIRMLQGDGISQQSIPVIFDALLGEGFSATNLALGMGGGMVMNNTSRDTLGFAYKCSSIIVDGKERDVFKSPATDTHKRSKTGRLDLIKNKNVYSTVKLFEGEEFHNRSEMRTVFENGKLLIDDDFETIRARANKE